jgi:hypothetical protein
MKEAFEAASGQDFYEWGKALETEFYRPQVEAEIQRRDEKRRRQPRRQRQASL